MPLASFGELTSRELALCVWATAALIFICALPTTRRALIPVIRALFVPKIVITILVLLTYVIACVHLLAQMHIWHSENLKATVLWTGSFALMSVFRLNKIAEDDHFFKKTLREILNVTVVIAFITQTYTYNLYVELLLVPFLVLLGGMLGVTGSKPEYSRILSVLNWIIIIIVFAMVGKAFAGVITHAKQFATFGTLAEFVVPILLTLMFLPFVYLLRGYSAYEIASIRLDLRSSQKSIKRYAMWRALVAFGGNVGALNRWTRLIMEREMATRQDVLASIGDLRKMENREEHPRPIPWNEGWCPYAAKAFLHSEGLLTGYYSPSASGWSSDSTILRLGGDVMSDTVTFHIEGDERAAKQLELSVSIQVSDQAEQSDDSFFLLATTLLRRAFDQPPESATVLLQQHNDEGRLEVQDRVIQLSTERSRNTYWRTLVIEVPSYSAEASDHAFARA